ncbi:MAG: YkvA family protein [Mycobacteriales bacterium]
MTRMVWEVVLGVAAGLLVLWLGLLVVLAVTLPDRPSLSAALRLLPDVVRLVSRLARDPALARPLRWRLLALLGYLALPFDLVPDFVPVLGYADDVVVVLLVLRSVVRHAGPEALERQWPGTPEGLAALQRLLRTG